MKILKAGWGEANGTSFSGYCIRASKKEIAEKLGIEPERMDEKVDYALALKLENGVVFTIYAWTNGRRLGEREVYEYHIGTHEHGLPEDVEKSLKEIGLTIKE